jgi:hypothetical protein
MMIPTFWISMQRVRDRLPNEPLAADVLAYLRETRLSSLLFRMVQFLRPLMSVLPSSYLAMRMSKVSFRCHYGSPPPRSSTIGNPLGFLAWSSSMVILLLWWPPLLTQPEMAKPGPSSHRARPCSYLPGMGPCQASFGDPLQISIVLRLWLTEPIDKKHCNC